MELTLSEVQISNTDETISLSYLNGFLNMMQNLVEDTELPSICEWAPLHDILY